MVGALQRRTFRFDPDILGFLGGLPEKEIRRDCRAGDGDHCRQEIGAPGEARNDEAF